MRRIAVLVLGTILATALPASAGNGLTRLGTDPALDAPPALDVTYLDVGRHGDRLHMRIGVANMIPPGGGYPTVPGIEWVFDVGRRTFIAEAVAGTTVPRFYLFEQKGKAFEQLDPPDGTYNWQDGYIDMLVSLKTIGARSGSRVSGTGPKGTEDVDAHVHAGPQTLYLDGMATTRDYVIP